MVSGFPSNFDKIVDRNSRPSETCAMNFGYRVPIFRCQRQRRKKIGVNIGFGMGGNLEKLGAKNRDNPFWIWREVKK
ncbi:hypothetical protein Hanom_Chr16g01424841 [Helianthus anomalus]